MPLTKQIIEDVVKNVVRSELVGVKTDLAVVKTDLASLSHKVEHIDQDLQNVKQSLESELASEKSTTEIKLNDVARENAKQHADNLVAEYERLKRDD